MSQSTLTGFFSIAKPPCAAESTVKVPCAIPAAADHKRPREEEEELAKTKAANSEAGASTDEDYAEYARIMAAAERPNATSIAKLFQEDPFDPYDRYASVWPAPAKGTVGDPVPYAAVVDTLADISSEGSRLQCVKLLSQFLLAVLLRHPEDVVSVIYLVVNKQAPQHEGVELGVGDALLVKVVAECCGMTEARAREEYKKTGDLAEVAQESKQKQSTLLKPRSLMARDVLACLREIALVTGKDTMRRRLDIARRLLRDAKGPEVNLIVRALQQKMRIGLAESSALAAVGYAVALHFLGRERVAKEKPEDLQLLLNTAAAGFSRIFYEVPSLEVVVSAVLRYGLLVLVPGTSTARAHARELSIRPGLPVKPQLAHPTSGLSVVLDRFQGREFTSEYKYDGERAQIHYRRGEGFRIFSRNSETHTGKYPDILTMLPQVFDDSVVESFILDAEVVAVNPTTGALQAFQVLQHRGRKNVAVEDVAIPVCVFAFDLLYLNGEPLLERSLQERRQALRAHFTPLKGKMEFAAHLDASDVEDIQRFLEQSIADGCEGLMIKTLHEEATYTPAKRSHFWLKLKKDYMDGATDTLDLVPIGAYYGKGKRTGVFGGFTLACYDAESDEYQSICKVGTGFPDDVLEQLTHALKPFALGSKPRYYHTEDSPDVWLAESQVWEVKAADLSISPVHYAALGLVDPHRGIALRFPRFVRVREDKKPTECTSAHCVAEMYKAQSLAMERREDLETA